MGNEFKTIASQDGTCSVDCGEYAGDYKIRFRVGNVERGTIDDNGLFTIDHIECRGVIKSSTFKKDTISTVGGSVLVRPGDTLASDMTASDTSTLTITGNEEFVVGDVLRIKDGLDDEWLTITSAASKPVYSVTRDREGMYGIDSNPTWEKGNTVVNYGLSGEGGVLLTSSLANAPYLSIFTHAGAPWTTITERGRFGNLNGYLGYSSDNYGMGIGSSGSGEANLTFDPVNGIRIRQGTTDILTFDMAGNSKISDFDIDPTNGIYVGLGSTRVQLDPNNGFHCGATLWADAPCRINQAGEFWAENAHIEGVITATTGVIGGWTVDTNKLYITGLDLDANQTRIRAYTGTNYVDITPSGLTGYDSVLGTTFKLLTDGSAPEFSSGIIKECVYEIYTSGVLRTDANVATNGGLIINNTDMKGYSSAGLKTFQVIYDGTDQGDFYCGDYDSGNAGIKYDHSAAVLNIRGAVTFQSASGYANITDKPTDLGDINSTEGTKLTGIASGADVTGSNTAANASAYTGTSIGTTYTAAKCTDATADKTSTHTAANASTYTGANISTSYTSAKCTDATADKTSTHTALNTTNVGTCPSSTVQGWRYGSTTYINGGDIYTNTVTATHLNGAGFGTLTITSGKLAINTTDALEIQASGNVKILGGGDIQMTAHDSNPSLIVFKPSVGDINIGCGDFHPHICFWPSTSNSGRFNVGFDTADNYKSFGSAYIRVDSLFKLEQYHDSSTGTTELLGDDDEARFTNYHGSYGTAGISAQASNSYLVLRTPVNGIVRPSTSATNTNLGNASYYWNDISYKTLTDRGCLGWFDGGVELQDGTIVTDLEAIQGIKKHSTKETIYGVPMLDYKSMPKSVYKPADNLGELLPRDENDEPYLIETDKNGKEKKTMAADGAETTALISIMLGAIKELDNKIKLLGGGK